MRRLWKAKSLTDSMSSDSTTARMMWRAEDAQRDDVDAELLGELRDLACALLHDLPRPGIPLGTRLRP
jgi:hypothetical protein